jgi:hypothetical protein
MQKEMSRMLDFHCPNTALAHCEFNARWNGRRPLIIVLLLSAVGPAVVAAQSPAADAQEHLVTASAAVALAQTGPNGTLMSMGCEYGFKTGTRNPQAKYVLIVKNGKGKTAAAPVQLDDHGTAGVLIDGWRPEDRPFAG